MHMSLDQGIFDLLLIMIGFLGRSILPLRVPALILCLFLDMIKWYLKTHPTGKKMSKGIGADEKLCNLYPDAVG